MSSATDVVVIGAGQSGLAATRALQARGVSPVVFEAGPEPAGSWPRYYDSLALFTPAGYSNMPGLGSTCSAAMAAPLLRQPHRR